MGLTIAGPNVLVNGFIIVEAKLLLGIFKSVDKSVHVSRADVTTDHAASVHKNVRVYLSLVIRIVFHNVGVTRHRLALVVGKAEALPLLDLVIRRKDLVKLLIPLIIEQLLAVTIGIADTVMIASCGEAAVSGISLVDTINVLLINVFSALATGGAVVVAQHLGNRDAHAASRSAKQLFLASAFVASLLAVIALSANRHLLGLVFGSIEADVMDNAVIYFTLSAISYPFLAVYNAGAALFRSMGNSKISMYTSVLMNIINVAGNYTRAEARRKHTRYGCCSGRKNNANSS